jgi:serine protease Do
MRKNMKKSLIRYLVFGLVILISSSSYLLVSGTSSIKVMINGNTTNIGATIINNKVYVDVDALSSSLSYKVTKSSNNTTINITNNNNDIIPDIVKSIGPSVVGIIGNIKHDGTITEGLALGTGVIIKSGGEILTNAHVVEDMSRIVVVLTDGTGYDARVKYIDKESDLAVIKIDKIGLTAAKLGKKADIIIGKTAIAVGTPMSFQNRNSASVGVISGLNRSIDGFYQYKLIQTDVALNPGNSGGPLVNLKGEVIGINSISDRSAQGLNYAIPIDTIQYVLDHFYKYGKVKRVSLGAEFEEDAVALYGLPSKTGLKTTFIEEGSCSEKYGLKKDDYIFSVNGNSVNTIVDLNEAFKAFIPGDKVKIDIRRNGKTQSITLVLDELK